MKNLTIILLILVFVILGSWVYFARQRYKENAKANGNGTKAPSISAGSPAAAPIETRPVLISGTGNEDYATGEVDEITFIPSHTGVSVPYDTFN